MTDVTDPLFARLLARIDAVAWRPPRADDSADRWLGFSATLRIAAAVAHDLGLLKLHRSTAEGMCGVCNRPAPCPTIEALRNDTAIPL